MSTGTSTQGGQQGGARQAILQRQVELARALAPNNQTVQQGAPNMNQVFNQATLGQAVNRRNDVGRDLQGKYMGWGTNVNAGRYFFTTKESVLMVPEWAQAFNTLFDQSRGQIQAAITSGARDFSLGIAGVYPDTPTQGGFYVQGITKYYPDDRARVSISSLRDQGGRLDRRVPPYLLPGSTAARAANAQGFAIGLAYAKNPQNQTGYLRVGSKGWRDALARWNLGTYAASQFDMEHLFGQGAVYGLGPIYRLYGINIEPQMDERDRTGQQFPVRFVLTGPANLSQLINNGSLMRSIQAHYDTYLKNPDQTRIGRYGAASLLLRHADKMNTQATGAPGDLSGVNQAVLDAWRTRGSVAGVARWGTGRDQLNYADFINRRGLTANPLRDENGNAIAREQLIDKDSGFCNIYGSGPGVHQRASVGGEYGFRFYKGSRKHLSTRRGQQGTIIAPETYFCLDTPDYVINPDRKIYQRGGPRATPQSSLEEVLARYGTEGFNAQDLRAQYADWTLNPGRYGTNEWFMLNPATGRRGFSRAAPLQWSEDMTPEEAMRFNSVNLTQAEKVQRSAQLANEAVNRGPIPTHPKTSYPTSGLASNTMGPGFRAPGAPGTRARGTF